MLCPNTLRDLLIRIAQAGPGAGQVDKRVLDEVTVVSDGLGFGSQTPMFSPLLTRRCPEAR